MALHHYVLPHHHTHQKAKLLSWQFLIVYLLVFILVQVWFNVTSFYKPGVLGVNSSITVSQIIADTNQERQKLGLSPLKENPELDQAALAKAHNMFEENYWSHFSPSGKDPWGFINSSGYKFSFAGENLARNFSNSEDVVTAWMNSPSHRENIVNSRYHDIGIAVVDGVLQGQKTTLVVQMFGTPLESNLAQNPISEKSPATKPELTQHSSLEQNLQSQPLQVAGTESKPIPPALIDPYQFNKFLGMVLVGMIGGLLLLDFVQLKKRGIYRISSHHFAHLSLLIIVGTSIVMVGVGKIL